MYRMTRREMLKLLGLIGASGWLGILERFVARGIEAEPAALPANIHALQTGGSRVIHVHDPAATSWDFSTGAFYQYVDQAVVSQMVDQGLMLLTNTASRRDAWIALIPNFVAGQTIAIKVNFNNYISGAGQQSIGALIEPVNALIAGLLERGFAASDIFVYDVTDGWHQGAIPTSSFASRCLYPGVQFVGYVNDATSFDPAERIMFNVANGPLQGNPRPLATVLTDATYLINMPILKVHPFTGVTLGFKNHYGSFEQCDMTHPYLPLGDYPRAGPNYTPAYSPLIDINNHPQIRDKTILVVGDGLFGANIEPIGPPTRWSSFGNAAPNSLFFATDPLAIECVMTDILATEVARLGQPGYFFDPDADLRLASAAGLGTYERGNPWASNTGTYGRIAYLRVSPGAPSPPVNPGGSPPASPPPANVILPAPTPSAATGPGPTETPTPASLAVADASFVSVQPRALPMTGYPPDTPAPAGRGIIALATGLLGVAAALLAHARKPKGQ